MKLDLLKFFLQISWEVKVLDNKKFILLSEKLNEIGKMIGGWLRQLTKENSAN
ncbi:MAG: four helix bundle protein [Patescibacteria group bacterium]